MSLCISFITADPSEALSTHTMDNWFVTKLTNIYSCTYFGSCPVEVILIMMMDMTSLYRCPVRIAFFMSLLRYWTLDTH